MSLELETNLGRLIVELFPEQSPKTCLNFIKLAKIHFYDYCVFHRVEKDFIAQTGDPTATGKGGESIFGLLGGPRFFKDELVDPAKVTAGLNVGFKQAGILGMANMGRDKNASQFFVTLADSLGYLDDKYTAFGRVCGEDSLGVLAKINRVLCNEKGRPLEKVWIKSVTITEDPFDDPLGLVVPESVTPSEAFLQFLGVDAAEKVEIVSEILRM